MTDGQPGGKDIAEIVPVPSNPFSVAISQRRPHADTRCNKRCAVRFVDTRRGVGVECG